MIYFDNAATSWPKPAAVGREVLRCLRTYGGNPGRSGHRLSLRAAEKIYETRERLCSLLHADHPERIVFTLNATYALNLAIKIHAHPGMHVLCSDMEHNSVYRPLARLARENMIALEIFRTDGNVLEHLRRVVTPNTGMLVCTHISNVCGRRLPVAEIGEFCRKRGILFILDASQSIGHIPIDFEKIGCDVLCAPGHKGLFGMQGVGFALFRQEKKLPQFLEGGGGQSLSPLMPDTYPERYEAGTLPTPAIASLCSGTEFVLHHTPEAIEEQESRLCAALCERLRALPGVTVYAPDDMRGSVLSFTARGHSSAELESALDRAGICVRGGYHCAPLAHRALGTIDDGTVRVSLSPFNTAAQLDGFYAALSSVL